MQGWLLDNNKTMQKSFGSKITYFASEFYDFDHSNDNSKIEEFDVSQEYLKSDFTEKSIILKELNQSCFMKTLEVYNKVSLYGSLYSWKKINEKLKIMESKNPKNMTKVFLKLFYLLNKKIRTKVQKSFVKIHNFTKNHEMKTYKKPIVKGINKLDQTFKDLDKKYFYKHSINSQQMVSWAFRQVNFYSRILKNRKKIQDISILVNKMIKYVSLTQFYEIMKKWEKTLQKIDIFVGSLNLIVNPVKRDIFKKLRKTLFVKQFFKHPGRKYSEEKNKKLKFKRVRCYNTLSNKNKGMIEGLQQKRSENQDYFENRKQDVKLTVNVSKINLKTLNFSLKAPKNSFNFEESMNFQSLANKNTKTINAGLNQSSLKPLELNSSFPDYFDRISYFFPLQKSIYQKEIQQSPSNDFKTIKSGRSMTFVEPKTNLIKQKNFTSNHNQYLVPICQNKQNVIISKLRSKGKNDYQGISDYQTLSFQVPSQNLKKPVQTNKVESRKPSTLVFSSKRPMKKIKSSSKDSITKLKSPIKSSQKPQKSKISSQINSEYYDSKKENSHKIYHLNKHIDLTTLSVKSLKSFSIERPIIKSVGTKSMKKQK